MKRATRVVLCATVAWATAGPILGQDDPPLLQGPKVRETRIPESATTFTGTQDGRAARRGALPARAFLRAIQALRADGTPMSVRLTEDQEAQIMEIVDEFRREEATERRASRDGGRAKTDAKDPPTRRPRANAQQARDAMSDEAMEGMREVSPPERREEMAGRLEELREKMPDSSVVQTKVWALLSEGQREIVAAELEKVRAEMEARRDQEYMERISKQIAAENAGPDSRDRLRQYLQKLPPEKREDVIRRIREKRAAPARRVDSPPAMEQPSPPPLDAIGIPKPERERD